MILTQSGSGGGVSPISTASAGVSSRAAGECDCQLRRRSMKSQPKPLAMSANGMACTRNRLREGVGDGSRARRTISAALSIARPVASWRSRASIAALSRTRVRAISSSISCRGLFPSYGARSLSVIGAAELGGDAITSLSLSNWLSSKLQIAVGDAKQDWLQYKREAFCPVPQFGLRSRGCHTPSAARSGVAGGGRSDRPVHNACVSGRYGGALPSSV
jgi:hypothetical protein